MNWLRAFITILAITVTQISFAQPVSGGKDDEFPEGTLFGQTSVSSNYVEKGLTQTDSGPAIQAAIGYKWTLAKLGLWASNVKFPETSDTVVMRIFGTYDFVMTSNVMLVVRADFAKYLNDGSRNGNILAADLNMFGYHVLYEKTENWEATGSDNQRVGFRKEFIFLEKLGLDLGGGYNRVDADDHDSYFDARGGINYRRGALKLELAGTFASNFREYGSRAGPFVVFGLEATF